MNSNEKLSNSPRTLSELASAYRVDVRTFTNWLKCETLKDILENRTGNYIHIPQIHRIIEHLGEPG